MSIPFRMALPPHKGGGLGRGSILPPWGDKRGALGRGFILPPWGDKRGALGGVRGGYPILANAGALMSQKSWSWYLKWAVMPIMAALSVV